MIVIQRLSRPMLCSNVNSLWQLALWGEPSRAREHQKHQKIPAGAGRCRADSGLPTSRLPGIQGALRALIGSKITAAG